MLVLASPCHLPASKLDPVYALPRRYSSHTAICVVTLHVIHVCSETAATEEYIYPAFLLLGSLSLDHSLCGRSLSLNYRALITKCCRMVQRLQLFFGLPYSPQACSRLGADPSVLDCANLRTELGVTRRPKYRATRYSKVSVFLVLGSCMPCDSPRTASRNALRRNIPASNTYYAHRNNGYGSLPRATRSTRITCHAVQNFLVHAFIH